MELLETGKKEIHNVNANENGWKLRATVTKEEGKITKIDGTATYGEERDGETPYREMTRFYGNRQDDALRMTFEFKHTESAVCDILRAMVDAIIAKYDN